MQRKHVNFPVTEAEHRQLKMLAAQEGKSIKELLLDALTVLFPCWRNVRPNLDARKK